jgi:septation ring formation regulator EzrA
MSDDSWDHAEAQERAWDAFNDLKAELDSSRQRISELESCLKVAEEALTKIDDKEDEYTEHVTNIAKEALAAIAKIRGKE